MTPTNARDRRGARRREEARSSTEGQERCRSCGRPFTPSRVGHLYCSTRCRHKGEADLYRPTFDRDPEALERLFDPRRDETKQVKPTDWHPSPEIPERVRLDACDTVAQRRRWYLTLSGHG